MNDNQVDATPHNGHDVPASVVVRSTSRPHKLALAQHLIRRRDELGISQEDIQELGGPSPETIRNWEKGLIPDKPRPSTLEGLDSALSWCLGSARTVLIDGSEPMPVADAPDVRRAITAKRVLVEQDRITQLVKISSDLMNASKRQPLRPDVADCVKELHLLAAELSIEVLNQ